MFDAVIFDLDGTLLDTERLTQAAGTEAFAEMGIAVEPAFLQSLIGIDDRTGGGIIRARYPHLDPVAFTKAWISAVDRHYAHGLPLKSGTLELLAMIAQPKALATSSTRAQVTKKLLRTGIGVHFAQIVTFDDVAAPKPDPEPYLLAARLVAVDPARCLVFEDSETGARSAHAAGMTVVQVPDVVPASGAFAHLVAPDLLTGARQDRSDLTPAELSPPEQTARKPALAASAGCPASHEGVEQVICHLLRRVGQRGKPPGATGRTAEPAGLTPWPARQA